MKLNPQAVINAGAIGSGSGSGGIQLGTNVPSGIRNNHRFTTTEERDRYFTANLHELERLKTIIVCGSDLQLWTGATAPSAYDDARWSNMTWVIQGEQGTDGEKGETGRGIARVEANVSQDDTRWMLAITYSDGTQETLTFPIPNSIVDIGNRLTALEVRWSAQGQQPVADLDTLVHQGRYQVSSTVTQNKPPLMVSRGSVEVYIVGGGDIIQVVHSIDGGIYSRSKQNGRWGEWVTQGNLGGGGAGSEQEVILNSLSSRLSEVAIYAVDMNGLVKQGRYSFNNKTANRPDKADFGSVDVHASADHILQLATTVEGLVYHRSYTAATGVWSDWNVISDQTGGATMHPFPRAASVFTTSQYIVQAATATGFYYIPWKFVLHDNYGCTARTGTEGEEQWWVCPKSGTYDMTLFLQLSFVKTPAMLPPMLVVQAWQRRADGSEHLLARFDMPSDLVNAEQSVKRARVRIENMPSGEMIRWRVSFVGHTLTQDNNPQIAFLPYRTMLVVDEADYTTAHRIAELARNTWANFQSDIGVSAVIVNDEHNVARINAVKWNASVDNITATASENPV